MQSGGLYSTFVRLQRGEQVAAHDDETSTDTVMIPDNDSSSDLEVPSFCIRWIRPDSAEIDSGGNQLLTVTMDDQVQVGVSVVRAFPATHSEIHLSLRYLNKAGREVELGIIEKLSDWPAPVQDKVRRALNRRYLLRILRRIQTLEMQQSQLVCTAETEDGVVHFTVPSASQNIKWFGENSCLLTDVSNNHFLIPDVSHLSSLEQGLLISPVPTL
jgi:hypothetical protein